MQNEVEKIRETFAKAMDQGRKIESMTSSDEWKFYKGWLQETVDKLTKQVMNGDFLDNQRSEDFTKGVIRGLQTILDGAEEFRRVGERAKKKSKDYEKQLREAEDV